MFDRLAASFALARSSWDVLRQDKKLLIFPLLSGVACLLVLASFALPFVLNPNWLDFNNGNGGVQVDPWVYVVLFMFYFCNYFVIVYFNAALISCALLRFNGETPTIGDGLSAAASRLPQIFAWALVSASVGVILKVIENAHEKAGQVISALLGTAWTVLTYFVVPVLVVEKVGPFQAMKRSASILRRTWGEAFVGRMGIGFFLFLLALPGLLLAVAGGYLLANQADALPGIALLGLGGLYFLGWMAASAALHGIFVGALYQYAAHGMVPQGFDQNDMDRLFAARR